MLLRETKITYFHNINYTRLGNNILVFLYFRLVTEYSCFGKRRVGSTRSMRACQNLGRYDLSIDRVCRI